MRAGYEIGKEADKSEKHEESRKFPQFWVREKPRVYVYRQCSLRSLSSPRSPHIFPRAAAASPAAVFFFFCRPISISFAFVALPLRNGIRDESFLAPGQLQLEIDGVAKMTAGNVIES